MSPTPEFPAASPGRSGTRNQLAVNKAAAANEKIAARTVKLSISDAPDLA